MTFQSSNLNIAVIGGGVAGIVASYLLQRKHQVTLFEKNDYVGGHTHTVSIPNGPDAGTMVDTGFIVHNDRTYPNFIKFIGQLGVERVKCPCHFHILTGVHDFSIPAPHLLPTGKTSFPYPSGGFWRIFLDSTS